MANDICFLAVVMGTIFVCLIIDVTKLIINKYYCTFISLFCIPEH